MDHTARGLIEKELDRMLEESINAEIKVMNHLKLLVKSKEDYLRGFLVGRLNGFLIRVLAFQQQKLEAEDIMELYDRVISGRSAEIEEAIVQALSR